MAIPLQVVKEEGFWWLVMNRPDRKNALNGELTGALSEALDEAEREGVPLLVLRGAGGTFSSGGDLKEFLESEDPVSLIRDSVGRLNRLLVKIRRIPSMVLAVVEGFAVGAGLSLACACDLVAASEGAIFNLGYRRIGFIPDGGGTVFLPKVLGEKKYNELYLLSRNFGAREAMDLGLVNFVLPQDRLEEELRKLIGELLALPGDVIGEYKALVNAWIYPDLEGQLEREREAITRVVSRGKVKERILRVLGAKGS